MNERGELTKNQYTGEINILYVCGINKERKIGYDNRGMESWISR